jgi:hypothetical protein
MKMHIAPSMMLVLSTLTLPAAAQMPSAVKGYTVTVFAQGVTGKYTAPDSVAVLGDHVFIGYGDGNDPAGLDGKSNQIVEYNLAGKVEWIYTVVGHNDGLKVNPYTHTLWAMQNEDANPNLVIIDPSTHQQREYTFAAPPPHGGGYDDIVFRNGKSYFSASNPANNPNTFPAIVEGTISGTTVQVTPVLEGNATAVNVVTDSSVTLNLQDPDSMTLTPSNDILLDSQGDSELVLVHNPGASQTVTLIPLSSPFGAPQVDDSLFIPASEGFVLLSDTPTNTVYKISKKRFVPGTVLTGGQGAPDANGKMVGFVGVLDLNFGDVRPVITGFNSPHGMGFVPVRGDEGEQEGGSCKAE